MKKRITKTLLTLTLIGTLPIPVNANETINLEKQLKNVAQKDANLGSKVTKWHEEQDKLLDEMRRLKVEMQWLKLQNTKYSHYVENNKRKIDELQKINSQYAVIELQLENALHTYFSMLQEQIANDLPFLQKERENRLQFLRESLESPDLSIGEKFRRFAEALSVEANYGVEIKSEFHNAKLGETFTDLSVIRLGRMAMYALTLDYQKSGIWNQQEQRFIPCTQDEHKQVLALHQAVANKQLFQLISIPLGNTSHE